MSEELNLRQAAERLIYWSNRIAAATTDTEENECCNERDKLFAVFRKVDAERMTAPAPAGEEGEALIEWLTGLVNEGGDAPIEIPVRDMKLLLSLLSSPRVERARALEEAAKVAEEFVAFKRLKPDSKSVHALTAQDIADAIRSLSPTDKQARG